jgi:hypothetical protein
MRPDRAALVEAAILRHYNRRHGFFAEALA